MPSPLPSTWRSLSWAEIEYLEVALAVVQALPAVESLHRVVVPVFAPAVIGVPVLKDGYRFVFRPKLAECKQIVAFEPGHVLQEGATHGRPVIFLSLFGSILGHHPLPG